MEKKNALIVEDEYIVAIDIKMSLENYGYEVTSIVSSGEAAIQHAEEYMPHLALIDLSLKGDMDGIETAYILQSRFNISIIYVTAYSDVDILKMDNKVEIYGFLRKPFDQEELHNCIESTLT